MSSNRLVLASTSPRRRELLSWAGLDFSICPVETDETVRPDESPVDYVRRLAQSKAEAAGLAESESWILAADTVVALGDTLLGKPADRQEALTMLRMLSGRIHQVFTGFCLHRRLSGLVDVHHVVTLVGFRSLSTADIARYIDSGEPWDKAGAYGIQGRGSSLTSTVQGSYTNVIGLPLAEVLACLQEHGLAG